MLIYNGQIIAGGGTIVLPMTRAEYEANKAILDSADVWVDLTDEPDAIATADQVAFWVGQTQKSVGYIGDIATKALAKVEPTDTALYLHEVGEYFINKDGNMCITDLQIAIGGTIVLDANCHVVDGGISSNLYPQLKATATANTSYASQLAELESAFNLLTDEQKKRAYILDGATIYHIIQTSPSPRFSCIKTYPTNLTVVTYHLSSHQYCECNFSGGSYTIGDSSTAINNIAMKLYA